MKIEDIRLAVSPLTDTVYVGTVSKRDPRTWNQRRDITSEFIATVLDWIPPGSARDITRSDGRKFEIKVVDISEQPERDEAIKD